MKQVMMTVGLMAQIALTAALTACAPQTSSQSIERGPSSDAIVGGQAVASTDPISHSTVQLINLVAERDPSTGDIAITGASFCTGTVIAKDLIISAAHCTIYNPQLMFIYFSDTVPKSLGTLFDGKNPLLRQVQGGITSPRWPELSEATAKDWGDISLLKFAGGLPAGYVEAKLIPEKAVLSNDQAVTLAGFGWTQGSPTVKATELRRVDVSVADAKFANTELMIKTGAGKGACHGDSGGPAYVTVGGTQYLAGLTSRADHDTDPGGKCIGLTIYTNVQAYLPWIAATSKILQAADYELQPIRQPGM